MRRWVVLTALCAASATVQAQVWNPGESLPITQMEFVKSDAPAPPAAGWSTQGLPDSWRVSRRGVSGYGWYRTKLTVPMPPTKMTGLLISMVGTSYAVYLNGIEVGGGGGMTGAIQRNGNQPQYVAIAPTLFRPGENWLHLRLRVASNLRGGLTPLQIGPRAAIERQFSREYFVRVTLTRSANVVLIVTGLLVGLLWLRRPVQTIYGHFAGLAVLWSLRNFHYSYNGSGIPSRLMETFILGSLGGIGVLLLLFMLRLTDRRLPRVERLVIWVGLSAPVVFLSLGEQFMSRVRLVWYGCNVLLLIGIIGVLADYLRQPGRRHERGPRVILAALLVTLGLGLHDYAVSTNLLPYGSSAMLAFGAPTLLAALVFTLASQYFTALEETERLNATLEQRIRARTSDLEASYRRMAELERSAAVATERERLLRDIHDGVGSQLITAKTGIARGQLSHADAAQLIDQCMDDLRLIIDSLDPEQRHIADALATLRYRLQPRMAAVGVESRWHIGQYPVPLAPDALLDVVRIAQEALTNALKHAAANHVDVRFDAEPDADGTRWQLTVRDNGCGFVEPREGTAAATAHRGLTNMRRRAAKLGARLTFESSRAAGTSVVVSCPASAERPPSRPQP